MDDEETALVSEHVLMMQHHRLQAMRLRITQSKLVNVTVI